MRKHTLLFILCQMVACIASAQVFNIKDYGTERYQLGLYKNHSKSY